MSLQVRCPLCGYTHPRRPGYGQYDLAAKRVESLGGNRGFEHTVINPPIGLEIEMAQAIRLLCNRYTEGVEWENVEWVDELEAEIDEDVSEILGETSHSGDNPHREKS